MLKRALAARAEPQKPNGLNRPFTHVAYITAFKRRNRHDSAEKGRIRKRWQPRAIREQ
jgi:hypothetical protein